MVCLQVTGGPKLHIHISHSSLGPSENIKCYFAQSICENLAISLASYKLSLLSHVMYFLCSISHFSSTTVSLSSYSTLSLLSSLPPTPLLPHNLFLLSLSSQYSLSLHVKPLLSTAAALGARTAQGFTCQALRDAKGLRLCPLVPNTGKVTGRGDGGDPYTDPIDNSSTQILPRPVPFPCEWCYGRRSQGNKCIVLYKN